MFYLKVITVGGIKATYTPSIMGDNPFLNLCAVPVFTCLVLIFILFKSILFIYLFFLIVLFSLQTKIFPTVPYCIAIIGSDK